MSTKKSEPAKSTKAPAPIITTPIQQSTKEQLDEQAKKSNEADAEAALKASTAGSSERPSEEANLPHDAEVLKNYNQTGVDETDTGFGKLDADEGQPQQQ
jgi:hypothetical protein